MSTKYKHIKLPSALFGQQNSYESNRNGRDIQNLPGFPDIKSHKTQLSKGLHSLQKYDKEIKERREIESDKSYAEVKIKFQGHVNSKLIERYQMSLYKKYDEKPEGQEYSNDVIIGQVSKDKLPAQKHSHFERLTSEFSEFISNNQLKSVFGYVEEINPLDKDQIITPKIKEMLISAGSDPILVDIVFGDAKESSQIKINSISDTLKKRFFTAVNTSQVHYCRVLANKDEIDNILASYAGIISVEDAPLVVFESGVQDNMGKFAVKNKSNNNVPIFLFDHPVCTDHPIIKPLSDTQVGEAYNSSSDAHGTQVGSLVIFGSKISKSGELLGLNKIKPVNIFPMFNSKPTFDEGIIIDTLKKHFSPDSPIIANLSINSYLAYPRKTVHRLTALFDDLAVDYNCLFVISAGNLFNEWSPSEIKRILNIGYPDYFKDSVTTILPPADSVNNLTIGSVTYQASPNSIAPVGEPSPITRRGFTNSDGFYYIKPDLVEYDSNFDRNNNCEDNGPFMAHPSNLLTRAAGTSFSAPLATHELGVLSQAYPEYTVNSLKALLIHFAKPIASNIQIPPEYVKSLVGFGLPDVDRALYSLNTSSTIVIEDEIKVGTSKHIKIPIPACISGSNRKRLRVRKTLVYNPKIDNVDIKTYNPIWLSARLIRNDGNAQDNATSLRYQDGAHRRSNVKTYTCIERRTIDHTGVFWEVEVVAEAANDRVPDDTTQKYSIVVTIEDMQKDDNIDMHTEIQQMIEVEVGVSVDVNV